MKFLIFGGNGLVGKSLQALLKSKGEEYFATYRSNGSDNKLICDISKLNDLEAAFQTSQPDIVINATNLAGGVNKCEFESELAYNFHFTSNKHMADLANKYNAKFIMISTDYVFDGETPPYSEEDQTNPLNKYGEYKLEAENYMINNSKDYIIARTTNVFGWDPLTKTPNYLMQLYFNLSEGKESNAPSFLSGNPTYVDDLTKAIVDLSMKNETGIFHVVGCSNINRYDWAVQFCELFNFNKELLNDIKTAPEGIVPRPLESNLSYNKLESVLGYKLSSVEDGLKQFALEQKKL